MEASSKSSKAPSLVRRLTHGAKSIIKTTLLRLDRLDDISVNRRLAVCRNCPSNHAMFRNGRLWSCGKLSKQNNQRDGRLPCGCILRYKARDAKANCPLGHWPVQSESPESIPSRDRRDAKMKTDSLPHCAPTVNEDSAFEIQLPDDTEFERGVTGRTKRILNVENRRLRIQARRQLVEQRRLKKKNARSIPQASYMTGADQFRRRHSKTAGSTTRRSRESSDGELLAPDDSQRILSLYDFFDRVVVVNLDRRTDRLDRLHRHLAEIGWPFRYPERFRAIDGRSVKPPAWWRVGAGAWGCHQSHVQIIEQALMDDLDSILILEDDVFFEPGLREKLGKFLNAVPDDWQQIYLGGQHLFQRRQPPVKVNEQVIRPFNVNRTHAFALHRRGMPIVYRWLTDYVKHSEHPRHHVDHRLGALHATGNIKVYAPHRWLAGQFESHSNIKGRVMPSRFWNGHRVQDQHESFVAVIGLHRSGSSCLAGVLYKLGVHMGDNLAGYESTGGYEAVGLSRICEKAYPFPCTELKMSRNDLRLRLGNHVRHVKKSASAKGKIAGGKYPHLCAMGDELQAICGKGLRVIHINRPLEESIESLKTRSRKSKGQLSIMDASAVKVQCWLWDRKQDFLSHVEHLTLNYADLLADAAGEIDRIIDYLGLKPSQTQRQEAIRHVQPHRRRHVVGSPVDAGRIDRSSDCVLSTKNE